MRTKLFIFICGLFLCGLTITAQAQAPKALPTTNLQKAIETYSQYEKLKTVGGSVAQTALKNAKSAIDKAAVESPKDYEVWSYSALIYSGLALFENSADKINPLVEQANGFAEKAKELDKRGKSAAALKEVSENIAKAKSKIEDNSFNDAGKAFNNKEYDKAYNSFKKLLAANPTDTTLLFNTALSAYNAKKYKEAIPHMVTLTQTEGYKGKLYVYNLLIPSYQVVNDKENATKALAEAIQLFPNDAALSKMDLEMKLQSGNAKDKAVIDKLIKQAESEPNNRLYPFYLGVAYSEANDYANAEAAYRKAISIDANFFEAHLNLGSLLLNSGIDKYNAVVKQYAGKKLTQPQVAEYEASRKKSTAEMDKALPHLTKATEIDPKSKPAWNALKVYYQSKNNKEKVAEIDAKMAAL